MQKTIQIFFIIIFFACLNITAAEQIILKNADELLGEINNTSSTRTFIGNIKLQQGNIYLTCDRAIQFMETNKVQLNGNVIITQDSLILKADNIFYDGNTSIATTNKPLELLDGQRRLTGNSGNYSTNSMIANFIGDVILEDDSLIIYADSIIYDRKSGNSFGYKNVNVVNRFNVQELFCDILYNYTDSNKTIAIGNVVLYSADSNKSGSVDTSFVRCDSLIGLKVQEMYYCYKNVEFINNQMKSLSDFGCYFMNSDSVSLSADSLKQCVIWLDSIQLHSDSVLMVKNDSNSNTIYAFVNCFATSKSDSLNLERIDQLQGDTMIIYINNDTLQKIESIGNAKSVFFSTTKENEPDGVIESSATQIDINMLEGKPNIIELTNEISGKYHPEPLINNKWNEHYLPTFRINNNPPKSEEIKKNSKVETKI